MDRPSSHRFRPSLTDLLGCFILASVVLVGATRLFGDSDPAMHVATGRYILTHGTIPQTDPFSATHAGEAWFAHEWLADILWALVYGALGWPGLVALSAALIATTYVLLYRFLLLRGDHVLPAFIAAFGAAIAAASHWLARPHLITVLLLVVFVATIERFLEGRGSPRSLLLLPAIVLLWVNLHGGFLIAFPVLGCYLIGAATTHREGVRPLLLASGACALAALVNPYGYRLPMHLLSYFAVHREALTTNEEFAPASPGDRAGLAILAWIALAVAAFVAERALGRRDPARHPSSGAHVGRLLAFGVTSAMTVLSIRHAEIAALFAGLLVSRGLTAVVNVVSGPGIRRDHESLRRHEVRSGGALFGVTLLAVGILAVAGRPAAAGYDRSRFPVAMVARLRAEGLTPEGPLFSRDLWGGYLTLEWPQARVFVDGRSDMYGDAFMRRYAELYDARPDWRRGLEEARVEWALLPLDAPLATAMSGDPQWSRERQDEVAVLFHRRR